MLGILCGLGLHHRDGRKARRVKDGYVSQCKRCGVTMARTRSGRWGTETGAGED